MMSPSERNRESLERIKKERAVERLNDHIIGAMIEDGVTVFVCKTVYAYGVQPQHSADMALRNAVVV